MGKKREKKGRMASCEKGGVRRGAWNGEEDEVLVNFITQNGHGTWRNLPKNAGLLRCGKSRRLRWTNYLRPDIKRGPFSPDEEATIIRLQSTLGNKWAAIASHLPGRTDNDIKNFWNSHLRKRFTSKPDYSTSESPDIKPLLLHPPSGDDHFLRLWNSQVGESFRHINDTTSESEPAEQKLEYKEEEQQVGAYSDQMDHQSGSMLNLLLDFPANLEFLQDPCDGLSTG